MESERFSPTKTFHPGPLKLEIKSIKNSTRTDEYLPVDMDNILNEGNGRAFITAAVLVSSMIFWTWKAFISFILVNGVGFLWNRIKHRLGWGKDEGYETYITLGHDNNHQHGWNKRRRHGGFHHSRAPGWSSTQVGGIHPHLQHGPPHHHEASKDSKEHGGWGWPAPEHDPHHDHRTVQKPAYLWYHPATKLFEQPTVKYSPWGKEYPLHGFDQRQAAKWKRKYNNKFTKYKRKYYRKKGKGAVKAQRQREKAARRKERQKAKADRRKERRKHKNARRKQKVEALKTKLQDWFNIPENTDGDDDDEDGDGDEENDDLRDKKWKETSSEMEKGKPPNSYYKYKPGQNYDPLPFEGKHHKVVRIVP